MSIDASAHHYPSALSELAKALLEAVRAGQAPDLAKVITLAKGVLEADARAAAEASDDAAEVG